MSGNKNGNKQKCVQCVCVHVAKIRYNAAAGKITKIQNVKMQGKMQCVVCVMQCVCVCVCAAV